MSKVKTYPFGLKQSRKTAHQQAAIRELKTLIKEGRASGIGSKSMVEIKAEARAELDLWR